MVSIWRPNSRFRSRRGLHLIEWLNSAQLALGWAIILLMLAIAGGIFLAQVSRTALAGRNAQILNEQIRVVQTQNAVMRQQIAAGQSLQVLNARTGELGLQYESINAATAKELTVVVPVLPDVGVQAEPLTHPVESFEEAVWLWMQEQAPFLRGLTGGR